MQLRKGCLPIGVRKVGNQPFVMRENIRQHLFRNAVLYGTSLSTCRLIKALSLHVTVLLVEVDEPEGKIREGLRRFNTYETMIQRIVHKTPNLLLNKTIKITSSLS